MTRFVGGYIRVFWFRTFLQARPQSGASDDTEIFDLSTLAPSTLVLGLLSVLDLLFRYTHLFRYRESPCSKPIPRMMYFTYP